MSINGAFPYYALAAITGQQATDVSIDASGIDYAFSVGDLVVLYTGSTTSSSLIEPGHAYAVINDNPVLPCSTRSTIRGALALTPRMRAATQCTAPRSTAMPISSTRTGSTRTVPKPDRDQPIRKEKRPVSVHRKDRCQFIVSRENRCRFIEGKTGVGSLFQGKNELTPILLLPTDARRRLKGKTGVSSFFYKGKTGVSSFF